MTIQRITVEDIIKAMDENGYEHKRRGWFTYNPGGQIVAACILGQIAINLKVTQDAIINALDQFDSPMKDTTLATYAMEKNDDSDMSYKQIANTLRSRLRKADLGDRSFLMVGQKWEAIKKDALKARSS